MVSPAMGDQSKGSHAIGGIAIVAVCGDGRCRHRDDHGRWNDPALRLERVRKRPDRALQSAPAHHLTVAALAIAYPPEPAAGWPTLSPARRAVAQAHSRIGRADSLSCRPPSLRSMDAR
jgi:hypothetical protein